MTCCFFQRNKQGCVPFIVKPQAGSAYVMSVRSRTRTGLVDQCEIKNQEVPRLIDSGSSHVITKCKIFCAVTWHIFLIVYIDTSTALEHSEMFVDMDPF